MKKLWILFFALTLCIAAPALADDPIVINTPGEHTITLSNQTISGINGPAIDIQAPATRVTIILKNNTTTELNGSTDYAGIANNGVDLVIRCEGAGETHTCTDTCGKLIVKGGYGGAGIGGNNATEGHDGSFNGSLTIMGGHITAEGGVWSSGIGSGNYGAFNGKVSITGGTVTATGGNYSAGIGSGGGDMTGSVTISGGTVIAKGGDISAGIGSCDDSMNGTVIISGGTVTATGGKYGAGIGSGTYSMNGTVIISGGTVTAIGGSYGAGIGSGANDMYGTVTLSGGTVTATGGVYGAGIGSGHGDMNGSIILSGGTVTATGDGYTAAIGAGSGGPVTEDAVIEVNPTSGKIAVKAGADQAGAVALEGSPFTAKTSLKDALKDKQYAKFEFVAPPATPVPSPTPAPDVPATGDSMNFALLASLAAVSMLGVTVLLRKRNEA